MKSHCLESGYKEVLDHIDRVASAEGLEIAYFGDPGCLVVVADRLKAKYAMGGAVSTAAGYSRFSNNIAVALFGDSAFFHSTVPAICNSSRFGDNILLVLLDNGSALTTGGQPHPGSIDTNLSQLSSTDLARSCGIENIFQFSPKDQTEVIDDIIIKALKADGMRLVEVIIA